LNQPKNISQQDIMTVEKAIQKILPAVVKLPQPMQTNPDLGLANSYFQSLTHTNRSK